VTPIIEALRVAHPGLLIHAFASTNTDTVNSPLVADMLRSNRYIDAVFTYRGKPGRYWIDYDFSDCLKDIPKNFVILPVIYSTDPAALHRVTALFETFNLPVRLPVPRPLLKVTEMSATASALLEKICQRAAWYEPRTIVFCHFGTRSSNYLYPQRDRLVSLMLKSGFLVVTLSSCGLVDPRLIVVDVGGTSLTDTIEVLRAVAAGGLPARVLSVNSVMWPVSSALGIANLGLHIFHDPSIHQYLYPNIFVVTRHIYPMVSPGRLFLASDGQYEERRAENGAIFTDFDPGFVFDCFVRMIEG
jgi:hypothetical protein